MSEAYLKPLGDAALEFYRRGHYPRALQLAQAVLLLDWDRREWEECRRAYFIIIDSCRRLGDLLLEAEYRREAEQQLLSVDGCQLDSSGYVVNPRLYDERLEPHAG